MYPDFQHLEYGKQRCFQASWLKTYSWLTYSRELDGGFCIACVLFGRGQSSCRPDRILVEKAMSKFNKATDVLKDHSKAQSHHDAMKDMARFISVMEHKEVPVDQMLHSALATQIEKNRTKLKSILKTVILCGKHNIPLRGHRDDAKYLSNESINCGNFQALLDFRIDAGDKILEEHFLTAPRNATYQSKTI